MQDLIVVFEHRKLATGFGVPDARGVVGGASDDATTVRAEGRARNALLVSSRTVSCWPVGIPYPRRGLHEVENALERRRHDAPPVWAEFGARQGTIMADERDDLPPVSASQMRAVLSSEAVTTRRPSGLKAASLTRSSWPVRTINCCPVSASQIRAVRSWCDEVTRAGRPG